MADEDPLDALDEQLTAESEAVKRTAEERLGMPFDQIQAVAATLFPEHSSNLIRQIKHHLIEHLGIDPRQMNIEMAAMVDDVKKYLTPVQPEDGSDRTMEQVMGTMKYMDLIYLGFIVNEYAELLFAQDEHGTGRAL